MRRVLLVLLAVVGVAASPVNDDKARELQNFENMLRRVIGGTEVEGGVWPWLVSLSGKIPTRTFFGLTVASDKLFCGASLIDRRWILTAAHCIPETQKGKDPQYWTARFGDTDRESSLWDDVKGFIGDVIDRDEWKDWVIKADKIIVHPQYDPDRKWQNDIALVRLSEPVPSDPKHVEDIQEVGLASPSDADFPQDNQECIFKGWGCTRGGGRVADVAFQVTLPKWNDAQCARQWRIQATGRLCAGHARRGMGICPGDSGGPLVCKKGNTWLQVGIASFTAANAPEDYPGVFTRVSAYNGWIKQTLRDN